MKQDMFQLVIVGTDAWWAKEQRQQRVCRTYWV